MNDEKSTIEETAEAADQALAIMKNVEGVKTAGGMLSTTAGIGALTGEVSSSIVTLYVVIDPEVDRSGNEIADEIAKKTKHLPCKVEVLSTSSITEYTTALGGQGVSIELYSTDNNKLQDAARIMGEKLEKVAGIKSVDNGLQDVPLHLSRYFPRYRMREPGPTPKPTLLAARETALAAGVKTVYLGNV